MGISVYGRGRSVITECASQNSFHECLPCIILYTIAICEQEGDWMIISIDFEGFPATELMVDESHVFLNGFGQLKSKLSL